MITNAKIISTTDIALIKRSQHWKVSVQYSQIHANSIDIVRYMPRNFRPIKLFILERINFVFFLKSMFKIHPKQGNIPYIFSLFKSRTNLKTWQKVSCSSSFPVDIIYLMKIHHVFCLGVSKWSGELTYIQWSVVTDNWNSCIWAQIIFTTPIFTNLQWKGVNLNTYVYKFYEFNYQFYIK